MKTETKRTVSVIVFFLLLAFSLAVLSKICTPTKVSHISTTVLWDGFYEEPEDSIDVIFAGPSTIYYDIAPTDIFESCGYTSYCLSSPDQVMALTELYIREAFRYQSPKLVVLEQTLFFGLDPENEPHYRTGLDHMRFSGDKLRTILELVRSDSRQSVISYFFPFLRYHQRLHDPSELNFRFFQKSPHYYLKGYSGSGECNYYSDRFTPIWKNPIEDVAADEIVEESLAHLKAIRDLCEQNGAELLMIKMPVFLNYNYARHNASEELFCELGIPFLDLNMQEHWEAMDLIPETDFQSSFHLNAGGAVKASAYIGEYMKTNYSLPDHRSDPSFAQWFSDADATRADAVCWLESYAANHPDTARTSAFRNGDGSVEVRWPRMWQESSVTVSLTDEDGTVLRVLLQGTEDTDLCLAPEEELRDSDRILIEYRFPDGAIYSYYLAIRPEI